MPTPDWSANILDAHGYVNKCCVCGYHFQHLDKRRVVCPSCDNTERSAMVEITEERIAANTDLYYKGRSEQSKVDSEFFKRAADERKANLTAYLKELRSETFSDESDSRRRIVEKILSYVERQ